MQTCCGENISYHVQYVGCISNADSNIRAVGIHDRLCQSVSVREFGDVVGVVSGIVGKRGSPNSRVNLVCCDLVCRTQNQNSIVYICADSSKSYNSRSTQVVYESYISVVKTPVSKKVAVVDYICSKVDCGCCYCSVYFEGGGGKRRANSKPVVHVIPEKV